MQPEKWVKLNLLDRTAVQISYLRQELTKSYQSYGNEEFFRKGVGYALLLNKREVIKSAVRVGDSYDFSVGVVSMPEKVFDAVKKGAGWTEEDILPETYDRRKDVVRFIDLPVVLPSEMRTTTLETQNEDFLSLRQFILNQGRPRD